MNHRDFRDPATDARNAKLAKQIDNDISVWIPLSLIERATQVVMWCLLNEVPCAIQPQQLMDAMLVLPPWGQGPAEYLDFVRAYTLLANQK